MHCTDYMGVMETAALTFFLCIGIKIYVYFVKTSSNFEHVL